MRATGRYEALASKSVLIGSWRWLALPLPHGNDEIVPSKKREQERVIGLQVPKHGCRGCTSSCGAEAVQLSSSIEEDDYPMRGVTGRQKEIPVRAWYLVV